MANLKFIFIVNDNNNQALQFIERHKNKTTPITFDTSKHYSDINLDDLIMYEHYYMNKKYLFFDNCRFGETNDFGTGQLLLHALSVKIETALRNKKIPGIEWVFIRITNYEGKNKTIDLLLKCYESKEDKDARKAETGSDSSKQVHFMNFGRTIILNKCFINSRYTLFADNISHEAINCFRADNNKRYLYLCSSGILKEEYFEKTDPSEKLPSDYLDKDKITYFDYSKSGKDEDGSAQYVFLRKATNVKVLDCAFENELKRQNYLNINYGQQNIIDIFGSNYYSGNAEDDESMDEIDTSDNAVKTYVTFEAEPVDVFVPSDNECAIVREDDELDGLKGSTMRHFVIEGSTFYKKIMEKEGSINWENENAPTYDEYCESPESSSDAVPSSIMSIIDREKKEVYYSNLISYVFAKSPIILNRFLEKCEIQKSVYSGSYFVNRELKNIDIFIKNNRANNKFEVVIENKIEAHFNTNELKEWKTLIKKNGGNRDLINQLEAEKEQYKNEHSDKEMNCQLSKYYFLARYIAKKNDVDPDNDVKYLIICPEQFVEHYRSEKDNYSYGEKYDVVSYKELYESIKEVLDGNLDDSLEENDIETIKEINKCLKVHTSKTNTVFISRNRHRFAKRILSLRNGQ